MPPKLPPRPSCEVVTITVPSERVGKATAGKWGDPRRGTRAQRGYGPAWDRLRLQVLSRDCHLCRTCQRAGRLTVATEVDHVINKAEWQRQHGTFASVDDLSNLEAICAPHHRAKTAREAGRPLRQRPRIGLDGYPVE